MPSIFDDEGRQAGPISPHAVGTRCSRPVDAAILKTGIVGSIVAAVCCATPALVIAFGAFGVSAWLAWADYVLIPMLIFFVGLTAYGLRRRRQAAARRAIKTEASKEHA